MRPSLSSAAPGASVRRYLSEAGEKEALRVLREQQRRQKRVTSDDVRLAVRAVASQGGSVAVPPDFPPSRWVLEFKRVHGFVQFNSFAFGAAAASGSKAAFGLPERLDAAPLLRPPPLAATAAQPVSQRAGTTSNSSGGSSSSRNQINDNSNSSNTGAGTAAAQVTGSSLSSGNSSDDEKERDPSEDSRGLSEVGRAAAYSTPSPSAFASRPFDSETQRQMQLQHSFSQRHRQFLQQQQRRAMLVDDHRRSAWPMPMPMRMPVREPAAPGDHEEIRSSSSSGSIDSDNGTTTGPNNSPSGGDVGPGGGMGMSSVLPHMRHTVSINSSSTDEMQDAASTASSSNEKQRGYKLSHTVPAETWEKAIAAVEQQGMSLRAAAKLYGVHFAALHRRVKKRAQGGLAKGNNGYFHPSDEAGIMRVVVARAELGVLMTFDELMRLVEAAALRKLPDISVDSARKLLTRFQSRNEQSIRHIIVDWPPPRPSVDASSDGGRQHQPYLEHPGFDFGPKPPVILRSVSTGGSSSTATAAAMAAAAQKTLFVPPSRLGPVPSRISSQDDSARRPGSAMSDNKLPSVSNERLLFVGPRARSEGDNDAVMVV